MVCNADLFYDSFSYLKIFAGRTDGRRQHGVDPPIPKEKVPNRNDIMHVV